MSRVFSPSNSPLCRLPVTELNSIQKRFKLWMHLNKKKKLFFSFRHRAAQRLRVTLERHRGVWLREANIAVNFLDATTNKLEFAACFKFAAELCGCCVLIEIAADISWFPVSEKKKRPQCWELLKSSKRKAFTCILLSGVGSGYCDNKGILNESILLFRESVVIKVLPAAN